MSTKSIDNISTVCGLDALYYQLKVEPNSYISFYVGCTSEQKAFFGNFSIISQNWTKQYTFFELKDSKNKEQVIARIGFKDLNTKDFLEYVKVQLDTYYMNMYGIDYVCKLVEEELKLLGLDILGSKVSRVDLNTYVYGYDFSYISYYHFSTLMRSNSKIYSALKDNLATFYLGSRDNNSTPLLRIYDKWLELKQFKDKDEQKKKDQKKQMICLKFKEEHNINLDDRLPLWNVEFELKRDLLRNYKIDTLEDLFCCANSLHSDIMKRMRLLTKKKKKDETNAERIPTAPIWNKIKKEFNYMHSDLPVDKVVPVKYVKGLDWILNRVEDYWKDNIDNLTPNQLVQAINEKVTELVQEQNLLKKENTPYSTTMFIA